jgi:hypothetical protein
VRGFAAARSLLGAARMYYDFVAHCRWPFAPVAERSSAPWLWNGLREIYPSALAAALMPNHLHVVAPTSDPDVELARLRHLLGAFARVFGVGWNRVPDPKPLATIDKVVRQVRYVGLNPCRPCRLGMDFVTLVGDPLSWEWTTHRDAIGAVVDPWVTATQIAEATGVETLDPVEWLHRYVSSDPSVSVTGTALPRPGSSDTLGRVVLASAAAHREVPEAVRRRGPVRTTFLGAAHRLGFSADEVAIVAAMHPAAARRRMPSVEPRLIEPALLCLGDERLLVRTDYKPEPTSRALGLEGVPKRSRDHSEAVGA